MVIRDSLPLPDTNCNQPSLRHRTGAGEPVDFVRGWPWRRAARTAPGFASFPL